MPHQRWILGVKDHKTQIVSANARAATGATDKKQRGGAKLHKHSHHVEMRSAQSEPHHWVDPARQARNTAYKAKALFHHHKKHQDRRSGSSEEGDPNPCDILMHALPSEGNWIWDENTGMYWSAEVGMFYGRESGQFYDPDADQWWSDEIGDWTPNV